MSSLAVRPNLLRQADPTPASGLLPTCGQLHPHADPRPHTELLGVFEDQLQLRESLHDGDHDADRSSGPASPSRSNSASLKPLQMIGVSLSARAIDGQQFGLAARLQAEAIRPAELAAPPRPPAAADSPSPDTRSNSRPDSPHSFIAVVNGAVDLAQPVLEDFAESQQDRQVDAAELQPVNQLP